jgi:uncharacterized protein YjbI with pentapeptide repeats
MANPKHIQILKQGVEAWNEWRREQPNVYPDLTNANLFNANLRDAHLRDVNLRDVNLREANLREAILFGADLTGAELSRANLSEADISYANLSDADLRDADLPRVNLVGVNFSHARLSGADFTDAELGYTTFAGNDLSEVKGLETVRHDSPSSIGVDTLYESAGRIPVTFLHGCGVPDDFIAFIPSHFGVQQAVQFYSCFISYSTRDEEFARRLYSRMRDEKLRVWFAPEDAQGGKKLYEQIERAIQLHDRLLLVLSESSMQSEWVITEIQRARETEIKEERRKLFPITIVEFDKVKAWRRFDADSGMDLAKEVREYFIPDFSNWKDHDAFEKAFERLLHDLRAEEARP